LCDVGSVAEIFFSLNKVIFDENVNNCDCQTRHDASSCRYRCQPFRNWRAVL